MKVSELVTALEEFQTKLTAHEELLQKRAGQRAEISEQEKQAALQEQSHWLSRRTGALRPYIERFDDQWMMQHPASGVTWDALEVATSLTGHPGKGHSIRHVLPKLNQILGRLENFDPNEEIPADPTASTHRKARGATDRDVVLMLAERFHGVVRQIRQRHDSRPTLDVADEYDVQDLFHALLTIYFDDIRKEEWAPSYAGGASRMDFLLPEIEAVVEIKMMRPSLSTKQLGEQLIVDIAKYKIHPACRTLFCVVYDADGRISNPRGVENDLSTQDQRLVTHVMIVPKH
jgi:hypothetical protein